MAKVQTMVGALSESEHASVQAAFRRRLAAAAIAESLGLSPGRDGSVTRTLATTAAKLGRELLSAITADESPPAKANGQTKTKAPIASAPIA